MCVCVNTEYLKEKKLMCRNDIWKNNSVQIYCRVCKKKKKKKREFVAVIDVVINNSIHLL